MIVAAASEVALDEPSHQECEFLYLFNAEIAGHAETVQPGGERGAEKLIGAN